jgi:hypothetical protein
VGSYSHECRVHENFKIILHVPASTLSQVPLPLLNRFEKYQVSMEQAYQHILRDCSKLSKVCNWFFFFFFFEVGVFNNFKESESENNITSIFEMIADGCTDFVDQLHTYQSQNRLLYLYFSAIFNSFDLLRYGFVHKETIASLMFDIARRTLQLKSHLPEIPAPFRLYLSPFSY